MDCCRFLICLVSMGVRGLWKVIEPTARPVLLENMRGKILAIDASIWIYHFIKAMRDGKGELLRAAHLVGFFRRICKLLFYEIKPVFVFDGAAPILKKSTTKRRQQRRQDREETARATANRLLTLQIQRMAENPKEGHVPIKGSIPKDAHYFGQEKTAAASSSDTSKPFQSLDAYHLPEIEAIAPVQIDDSRLLTEEELNDYAEKFTAEARAGFIDSATIDFKSPAFADLPLATQYQLVNTARLKSRLRMGYSAEQLDAMFPNSMDFSRFQIQRVAQRNSLTQRLMGLAGLEEDLTLRVSSEKNKHYMLKRNQEGWTLSLDNKDSSPSLEDRDKHRKPAVEVKSEPSDSDEFEDVDLEPETEKTPIEENPEPGSSALNTSLESVNDEDQNPNFDTLFGFEASVQRQKLYGPTQSPDPMPLKSKPSSFLFSKQSPRASSPSEASPSLSGEPERHVPRDTSADLPLKSKSGAVSFIFARNDRKPSSNDHDLDRRVSEGANEPTSENENAKKSAAQTPPWFDQSENTFEPMQITDRTQGNLVPIEMVHRLREPADLPVKRAESVPSAAVSPPKEAKEKTPDMAQTKDVPEIATEPAGVNESAEEHDSISAPSISPNPKESLLEEPVDAESQKVLTEEDIMLAEADALADEDEDQDLADMMIGEVEENERFNRTLNILTDGASYRSEIQGLKEQFASQKRDADTVTEDMISECQELLQLFGIPYITAPMEAEAQCAELQSLDLVDGVVTDDGDAFLFGDVVVYRNMFSMAKYVECYSSGAINEQLGLDREKLVNLAFLLGSDYTDGILGIGPVIGVELLAEFESLVEFRNWWLRAQREPTDENLSSTFKRQFYKRFKSKLFLAENFPEDAVLDAYRHPVVDSDDAKFEWASLDLEGLKTFFAQSAGWSPEYTSDMLVPIVEENKRRELIRKGSQQQSNLDQWVIEKNVTRSKRAQKATNQLKRKR